MERKKLPPLLAVTQEERRCYSLEISINNRKLTRLIIDPHYQLKHSSYIDDELIYNLVLTLNGRRYLPKARKGVWEYFDLDLVYQSKSFLLVWCLEDNGNYFGVINCY